MNKGVVLILGILLWLGSVDMFSQETVEAIVAIVNDDVITLSDYQQEHDLPVQTLVAQTIGCTVETKILQDRQIVIQTEALRHVAYATANRLGLFKYGHAQDLNISARGSQQTEHHAYRRRFAGSIGSQKTEDLTRVNIKTDLVDGGELAEAFD